MKKGNASRRFITLYSTLTIGFGSHCKPCKALQIQYYFMIIIVKLCPCCLLTVVLTSADLQSSAVSGMVASFSAATAVSVSKYAERPGHQWAEFILALHQGCERRKRHSGNPVHSLDLHGSSSLLDTDVCALLAAVPTLRCSSIIIASPP